MAAALATSNDVEAILGRVLTSDEHERVDSVLLKASELFRRRSGQEFTAGTSAVRLKVNGGRVYLPQRPVVAVTTVLDDDGDAVVYTRAGQWLTLDLRSHEFVTVSYSHGGAVPDLVRLAIADVARQVMLVDQSAQSGGLQSSTTAGPFSQQITYAPWAVGGATRLSPDDIALADSYRAKVPTVWVQQP